MKHYDLVVIGGGPAGIAAALEAHRNHITSILVIEREPELGGILNQCIHNGFGLHHFKKELTGPEYSGLIVRELEERKITYVTDTTVLKLTDDKVAHAINATDGYMKIQAKAIVLATGCRERTRGAIRIHGSRPAGIYTAGTAQKLVNIDGYLPGKKVVILGSGDIGLIMARRMTLEGAEVVAVLEILPYSNGITRNIVQCLHDFNIPLLLETTITKVHGQERVEGVTIAQVNRDLSPIKSSEKFIPCDTVLLSVGLIPENEVARSAHVAMDQRTNGPIVGELRQTDKAGIFACGNALQVHDLVDFVSEEGSITGLGVAQYLNNKLNPGFTHTTTTDNTISYVIPQKINIENIANKVRLFMRVKHISKNSSINAYLDDKIIASKKEHKFLPAEIATIDIEKQKLLGTNKKEILLKVEKTS